MPNTGATAASLYDVEANYQAYVRAATLEIIGEPVRAVARDTGIQHNQARRVGTICSHSIEEFREHSRRNMQLILDLLHQRLPDLVGKLKPMEAFVATGIMSDKFRDATGGSAPTSVHITNIQVNGSTRSEALTTLIGGKQPFGAGTRSAANSATSAETEATEIAPAS